MNKMNKINKYKTRLGAQCFLQKHIIDYDETRSPVIDITTLKYLISLAISQNLEMKLMDVYLYGDLDIEIHLLTCMGT